MKFLIETENLAGMLCFLFLKKIPKLLYLGLINSFNFILSYSTNACVSSINKV